MKPILKLFVIAALILGGQFALAASSSFVGKQADKSGGFLYTYKYFCASSAQGTLTLNASSDEQAKKLADAKAKRICEE